MARKAGMDRKDAIRAAAVELFAKQGFHATSTNEVAKLAGVSEGTIFYHFETKEGILLSVFEEILGEAVDKISRAISEAESGLEAVLEIMRVKARATDERPQESMILVRDLPASLTDTNSPHSSRIEQGTNQLLGLLRNAVEIGLDDGSIRQCDPTQMANLLLALMTGLTRLAMTALPDASCLEEDLVEFCRRALATRPA